MTKWQKYLKTISVLTVVLGAVQGIAAILAYFAAFSPNTLENAGTSFAAALSLAIALTVSAAIQIVPGILGLRAANNTSKIKAAYISGWICLLYNAFNQLYNLCVDMSPINVAAFFAALILPVLYLIFAFKAKQNVII